MTRVPRSARLGVLVLGLSLSACAGNADNGNNNDDNATDGSSTSDAAGCSVYLQFDPPEPQVGVNPELRAIAQSGSSGIADYTWEVSREGVVVAYEYAQPDTHQQIRFPIPVAGVYRVHVDVTNCNSNDAFITVATPMAASADYRLRVLPPPSLALPPSETLLRVYGGGDATTSVQLSPGLETTLSVRDGSTPVPAYLQLEPVGVTGAITEAFTGGTGDATAHLLPQQYSVLVVPVSQSLAPVRVPAWSATAHPILAVSAGRAVTGTVRAPDGSPVAGASVQLLLDGVPTTYALTSSTGAFTVRAAAAAAVDVAIAVTAPAATGLPKLVAHLAGAQVDLAQPLAIAYTATLVTRDLAGLVVTRGAPLAGAQVVVTGSVPVAGHVQSGANDLALGGEVRVVATASAAGVLPSARVLAAPLSAVITASPGDLAVEPIDTTAAVPATIAARPMIAATTVVADADAIPLAGAELELVPEAALAAASTASIRLVADSAGVVHAMLAAGGSYQARLHDPLGRGGPVSAVATPTSFAQSYLLPHALKLHGFNNVAGNPVAVERATVQLLCSACTGVERDRPLAETTTEHGTFLLTVPDPGLR